MSGRVFVRFAFAWRIVLALSLLGPIVLKTASPSEARGPLRTNPANPRYFVDSSGNAVYLAGSYQNPYNLLSGSPLEVTGYFDFLKEQNQNFTRLWAWEQSPWIYDQNGNVTFTLQPYERTGPGAAFDGGLKFDLTRFNQAYFDQLRSRIIAAGQRGIYVSLILFEGFSTQRKVRQVDPWLADPFHGANNVNGINADENSDGRAIEFFSLNSPPLTALQEAFVRKVVDTLEDLDNVLYEISGDTLPSSLAWQFHMLDYVKRYQATKLNRHPIGVSQFYGKSLADVLSSSADWVVIQGSKAIPAAATANKILFLEGSAATSKQPAQWVWQSFMRGYNPINSEWDGGAASFEVHAAIGQTKAYAALLDMASMTPSDTACSNRLCLVNSRSQYLTYLPAGGSVTLDLSNVTGNLIAAWFDPATGETVSENAILGGQRVRFSSPARAQSILQVTGNRAILSKQERTAAVSASTSTSLVSSASRTTSEDAVYASRFAEQDGAVATPTITPNGGIYPGSVKVSLQTSTPGAAIYYTTNGETPTTSSQRYKNAFTLSSSTLVKAIAFKNNMSPSAPASAWFSNSATSGNIFDYSLAISGDVTVIAGTSGSTNVNATLNSGSAQAVSFAVSGLPSGATATLSASSCNPSCSSALNIVAAASTPTGNFPITVTATAGGLKKAAAFALTVAAPSPVAAPVITPNGGNFANSVSVSMATSTSGASIYYTTNGSSPTQSSTLYAGPITLASSALIKAKAFKSGNAPSAEASAFFTRAADGSGLVAHWKFDESSGMTTADSSGNNNMGTLVNSPRWTSGVVGSALYFDGSDDNVIVVDSSSLNLKAFTLSAWVNPAFSFTDFRSILAKNYKYYLYASAVGFCGDGTPLGGIYEGADIGVCHAFSLPINNWTHLTLTFDGSNLTLYRNATSTATSAVASTLSPSTGTLQIGASEYGEYFAGTIDEVRIYNRALSDTEIKAIYSKEAVNLPFDYTIGNSGDKAITAGASTVNNVNTVLVSGISQPISFTVSGLPAGATGSFSTVSCTPNCSTVLTITTTGSTPAGNYPIVVTSAGGGVKQTTSFTLGITLALTAATPTFTPNGGSFSNFVSVTMQSATVGSSIYYTTDGSTPTQAASPYTGAVTLASNATIKARAFKSGYNPSSVAAATFTTNATSTSGTGMIYYVAKTGSDTNSCTQAQNQSTPKLSISAGISCLSSGDTLNIKAGTYVERIFQLPIPSGTSYANATTIQAYNSDVVVLRPNSGTILGWGSPPTGRAFRYIVFRNLVLDGTNCGSDCDGVGIGGGANGGQIDHIKFDGLEIKNVSGNGMQLGGDDGVGNFLWVTRTKIHDGGTAPSLLGYRHCWYVEGSDNLIENSECYNWTAYGIHNYGPNPRPSRNIYRNNRIYNVGTYTGLTAFAIVLMSGDNNSAYGNILNNNQNAINIASNNNLVYNNTLYGNGTGFGGVCCYAAIFASAGIGNVIKNNIVFANQINSISTTNTSSTLMGNNLVGNPSFIDASNSDFRLQSGSAAIDAGTSSIAPSVTLTYNGLAPDIGAIEH